MENLEERVVVGFVCCFRLAPGRTRNDLFTHPRSRSAPSGRGRSLGYLIKPETARAIAATAVNSRTRVAFFESIEYVFLGSKKTEEDRKAREKFMEDRKQIK